MKDITNTHDLPFNLPQKYTDLRWAFIENTNQRYILFENGDVYSLYNYNWKVKKHLIRKTAKKLSFCIRYKKALYVNITYNNIRQPTSLTGLKKRYFPELYPTIPYKTRQSESKKKACKELKDSYLKRALRLKGNIKPTLLKTKRKQLCLYRKLKQITSQK